MCGSACVCLCVYVAVCLIYQYNNNNINIIINKYYKYCIFLLLTFPIYFI